MRTKACCELLINDYTRRDVLDGRVARLPTVIPRPEPNSGLPAAFSDVLREPLMKRDSVLRLPPQMRHAVCGYRVLVRPPERHGYGSKRRRKWQIVGPRPSRSTK